MTIPRHASRMKMPIYLVPSCLLTFALHLSVYIILFGLFLQGLGSGAGVTHRVGYSWVIPQLP